MFSLRIKILAKIFLVHLIFFSLLRVLFLLTFVNYSHPIPIIKLFQAFVLGVRFDTQLIAVMVLPFFLLSWFPILQVASGFLGKVIWKIFFLVTCLGIFIIYIADFGNYAYLGTRVDASIISLLSSPEIALNMVAETYPIIPIFLSGIILFWIYYRYILHWCFLSEISKIDSAVFWQRSLYYIFSFIILFGLGYGKFSRYSLRVTDAYFTTYAFANHLSLNPVLFFIHTMDHAKQTFDIEKTKEYYPLMLQYLNLESSPTNELDFTRSYQSKPGSQKSANIVVILMETFPTYKVGAYGNTIDASPHFDALAKTSMHFTRFFVPKNSTAASLFSLLTGIPDVSVKDRASTRDPFAVDQKLFSEQFVNYKKYFFIGGSANWGDMNGFLNNNMDQVQIIEEGDYDVPEVNAWGVSDYHLFQKAHSVLSGEKDPFFAIILTAGHHPSYEIPADIPDFESIKFLPEHYNNGFTSEGELNTFRFMDFSMGKFINWSKNESYYDNTIFIILGDHGIKHKKMQNLYGNLDFQYHQVPLLIHSPNLIGGGQEINTVFSEIDIFPTLLGMMNIPYENSTLGQDYFSIKNSNDHYAFIFGFGNPRYGLISNNYYFTTDLENNTSLFAPWSENPNLDLSTVHLKKFNQMKKIAAGIYESSRYLRYNNKK